MKKQKQKTKAGKGFLSLLLAVAMLLTLQEIPVLAETAGEEVETNVKTAEIKTVSAKTTGAAAKAGMAPVNPVHTCTKKDDGTDTTKWSYVYFGSYPQTEVTGNALTAAITGASYDANGDAWVNGTKYRKISKSNTNNTAYFGNSEYRYFKWERIKWRVLRINSSTINGSTMFVVADKGLDCKDYHDPGGSVTWETCTLRNWLNNDFYGTAFSSREQGAIVSQTVVNEDNPYYHTEGGNNTWDKVFLLSIGEVTNPLYGFCENYSTYSASRWVQASDYAHARGVYTYSGSSTGGNANCWWWLRSPGYGTIDAAEVFTYGDVYRDGSCVSSSRDACVPALHINLSSDLWSMADDGTSGEGGGGGTGTDPAPTGSVIQCRSACTVEKGQSTNIVVHAYEDDPQKLEKATASVKWVSEDPSVATVKGGAFQRDKSLPKRGTDGSYMVWTKETNITVTGVSEGTTTIVGTAADGSVARCKITVDTDLENSRGCSGSGGSLTIGKNASGSAKGVSDFFPDTWGFSSPMYPVEISRKENPDGSYKIKGSIGIGRSSLLDDETEWNQYKKNMDDLENIKKDIVDLHKKMKKYGTKSASILDSQNIFKASPKLSAIGYFECSFDKNGYLISQEGKIETDVKWSGKAEREFLTPIGFLYLNLNGGIKGSLKGVPVYDVQRKIVNLTDSSFSITPSVTLEGGYGINKVAAIGAQGKASIPIVVLPVSSGSIEASASVRLQLVFVIDYTKELATYKKVLWDDAARNGQKAAGLRQESMFSQGTLSAMDTSFAAYESGWNGGGVSAQEEVDATGGAGDASVSETVLMDGILPSSLPMQARIGDKDVLVFQSYDSARNTLDSSVLKYSVCENGIWSEPQPVWDNGCSDMFADMKVVNDKLVLAWQKAKAEVTGDIDSDGEAVLEEIAKNSEICFAVFDEASGTFTNQAYVTDNESCDTMPRICDGSDEIILSWVRNDAADLMQETGDNAVYTAAWNGEAFGEEELLTQSFGTIEDFITYWDGTDVKAVYAAQIGEGEEKANVIFNGENQALESLPELVGDASSTAVSGMRYEGGTVEFFLNGTLYRYNTSDETIKSFLAGESAFGSTAKFCSNGEKSGYVWSLYDEETDMGSIVVSMAQEGGYGEPVTLYEKKGAMIRYISPALDAEGNWSFLVNAMQTKDNETAHHSLMYLTKEPESETALAGAFIDESKKKDGLTGIDYYLKNTGDTPIHSLQMKITLADGSVITKEIPVTIHPGESAAETVYADLSGVDSAQEVSISIYAKDQADKEDCTVTDSVGLSDVAVTGTIKETGNQVTVTADLSNASGMDADTTLHLYCDETQTKELCAAQTAVITANGRKQIQMTVNKADIVYNKNDAAYLTLKAVVKDGDYNEDNNVSYVILYKEKQKTDITNAPAAPKPTAIKGKIKAKSRGFLVKWKKQTDVTGYQIQYSTNKKFKKKGTKLKTVSKPSAAKLTVKKLKAGKKYYVRIRTCKTVNGTTYYSDWSKAKTVKIKR